MEAASRHDHKLLTGTLTINSNKQTKYHTITVRFVWNFVFDHVMQVQLHRIIQISQEPYKSSTPVNQSSIDTRRKLCLSKGTERIGM